MEKRHRNIIQSRFKEIYRRANHLPVLPDNFEFMDLELMALLEERVTPYLDRNPTAKSDEIAAMMLLECANQFIGGKHGRRGSHTL